MKSYIQMPSKVSTKMTEKHTNICAASELVEIQLPAGFAAMETQVAGHTFDTSSLGLLQDNGGCVLKPLGKPECGEREKSFYENLQEAEKSNDSNVLQLLSSFVPKYYKTVTLVVNNRQHTFLKMEDLTKGMRKPCIMDIKVGKRTWDPMASEEKRCVEEQKYVRCKQVLGLCIPGFQVYTHKDRKVLRFSKEYGKNLDSDGFRATIALFINAQNGVFRPLVFEILKQLYRIREWFKMQTLYNFYASSLLIVYDYEQLEKFLLPNDAHQGNGISQLTNGDLENNGSVNLNAQESTAYKSSDAHWVKVKMIDFAHVFPTTNQSLDTNYIFGLENLIVVFEELMNR
ncbi:PREDICTED: inositol polyphosphate multikinase [Bactrocera latifrons]|uniref:Kinase n=1 Tax=Bactrocera latifrons TaxID=174628 RepID=A0A0K8WM46_BACLA|nr:PREDICTED: inositol polyphosphate multikinase [Bactrocera latifrons]